MTTSHTSTQPSLQHSPQLSGNQLRTALANIPTSIINISALVESQPDGLIAGSFLGISLDPPLVAVSIQEHSSTWQRLKHSKELGISVLTEDHAHLVRQLAGPADKRYEKIDWFSKGDAVFLDLASVHMRVSVDEEILIGDHILAVLKVHEASEFIEALPLIFHESRIRSVRI